MMVSLVGLSCQILDIKQLCHPLVVIIYHLIFIFFSEFLVEPEHAIIDYTQRTVYEHHDRVCIALVLVQT